MNEEWFEFVGYSESRTKYVNIDEQLNELCKTHEIIEVHFSTYSSSDWNYLSGGTATALVRARKREVANE
ncbi:hypothetical protein EG816_001375 [Listeria monocytogenes]|nr:hypothetical protein [Listeria monocytogenes]EJT5243315.1 hypothetical protein [Listeria monocytogenes]EJT5246162.1 hypothetical protein [Listeria monocytogenes]